MMHASTHSNVRFAVEYERSQQSTARYAKLCSILASEKYLHLTIFFFDDSRLRLTVMAHLKSLAESVCFVDYEQFLQIGGDAVAHYWNGGQHFHAPLRAVLKHASEKPLLRYTPIHQLNLKGQK
jgi:hypothetical protein